MDEKKLAHFKLKLEEMSSSILSEADKTISEMTDHSDNYPDPTDRASAESDRSFELRIRDRERKLLNKIKKASDRIENGTYGICDECGDEISIERLEARPVTTYCIECKTRQEADEKSRT
ncbi:MAG: RNA polymerase-binding protein DksA [Proteobacteria bacterium]|nr:RNA polymerase-binding protein DksA [Pseudomonadota bacterium]MBU1737744.1 RNA polymerase-binding protein DksA [Pseudomonadota bacterium]